jgi:hypothetical protein
MPADPHPRYVVRSITGYACTPGSRSGGNAPETTAVWISDAWYGYAVVQMWSATPRPRSHPRLEGRLASARCACALLNAEHNAWLARGAA